MGRLPAIACLLLLALPAGAEAADRDRDRLPDGWERRHGLSATRANAAADPDGDGASNRAERRARTHPRRRDTDRDGLRDGFELKLSATSPRRRDTDRDGIRDGAEDRDRDGLSHSREAALSTHPRRADSDRDGLSDGRELELRTDPLDFDTDGDGWRDARELALGSGPRDKASRPKKPDTRIVTRPRALLAGATAAFSFSATVPSASYQCRLDAGAWRACGAATAVRVRDGVHLLSVRALNVEGWVDETPATWRWSSDTSRPVVRLTSSPGAWLRSTTGLFRFSAGEANVAYECRLDLGAWRSCGSPVAQRRLSQGSHSFVVRARDRAGNLSALATAGPFVVDTVAPNTSISPDLELTATEQASFECSLDGAAWAPCTSPVSVEGLAPGAHTLRARAVDPAGNRDGSPARSTFRTTA